jgi:DNA-directed RNA polymerase specialized sigma24 family protein
MTTTSPLEAHHPSPPGHLASAATRALLRRYVARRVPASDVEDVVQATLCDAIASGRAPCQAEDFRRWVLAIARCKVVDTHRARGMAPVFDAVELTASGAPAELTAPPPPVEAMSMLRWAERQLAEQAAPPAPRARGTAATLRWMLREAEGDKLEAIAADEALPAERVRQRVSRLRRWMRGRWLAEMALIAVVTIAAAGALRGRHEAILPELGASPSSSDPRLLPELGVPESSSDPRLLGAWQVVSFTPAEPLSPARRALVNRLVPGLAATFDGQTLRATARDFQRTYAALAAGGRVDAVESARGARFTASYAWDGADLVVTVPNGPWGGVVRLSRGGATPPVVAP